MPDHSTGPANRPVSSSTDVSFHGGVAENTGVRDITDRELIESLQYEIELGGEPEHTNPTNTPDPSNSPTTAKSPFERLIDETVAEAQKIVGNKELFKVGNDEAVAKAQEEALDRIFIKADQEKLSDAEVDQLIERFTKEFEDAGASRSLNEDKKAAEEARQREIQRKVAEEQGIIRDEVMEILRAPTNQQQHMFDEQIKTWRGQISADGTDLGDRVLATRRELRDQYEALFVDARSQAKNNAPYSEQKTADLVADLYAKYPDMMAEPTIRERLGRLYQSDNAKIVAPGGVNNAHIKGQWEAAEVFKKGIPETLVGNPEALANYQKLVKEAERMAKSLPDFDSKEEAEARSKFDCKQLCTRFPELMADQGVSDAVLDRYVKIADKNRGFTDGISAWWNDRDEATAETFQEASSKLRANLPDRGQEQSAKNDPKPNPDAAESPSSPQPNDPNQPEQPKNFFQQLAEEYPFFGFMFSLFQAFEGLLGGEGWNFNFGGPSQPGSLAQNQPAAQPKPRIDIDADQGVKAAQERRRQAKAA